MKRLFAIIVAAVLCLHCLTPALGAEGTLEVPRDPTDTALTLTDGAEPQNTDSPTADTTPLQESADDPSASGVGIGSVIADMWNTHSTDIFSCLTLVMSLLIAYFFRRGLLPTVYGGLKSISSSAEAAVEETKLYAAKADDKLGGFISRCEPLFDTVNGFCDTADTLSDGIARISRDIESAAGERARIERAMKSTAEMLCLVFTSANLPEYAKEQIAGKYKALINEIGGNENDGGDENNTL